MSQAIAFTIVRENGLQHMKKVLQEGESNVKMAAISLIRNLSHYPKLQPDIGNCTFELFLHKAFVLLTILYNAHYPFNFAHLKLHTTYCLRFIFPSQEGVARCDADAF